MFSACIWTYKEDPDVIAYMGELDRMHKVTLRVIISKYFFRHILFQYFQVENEEQLLAEAKKLETNNIAHKVWIEDDMSVCIAVKPYSRDFIKPLLKHLPLYK